MIRRWSSIRRRCGTRIQRPVKYICSRLTPSEAQSFIKVAGYYERIRYIRHVSIFFECTCITSNMCCLFKVARLDFLGDSSQVRALTTSPWVKIWENDYHNCMYYIKRKISYDLGFIAIGVAMATWRRHYVFYYLCFSLYQEFFFFEEIA